MSGLSNLPPGVTGREYQIGGAQSEWEETRECPHCGWEGEMHHEAHYEFGRWAWCANPERVEVMRNEHGFTTGPCPLVKEGFEVEAPEPEQMWPE